MSSPRWLRPAVFAIVLLAMAPMPVHAIAPYVPGQVIVRYRPAVQSFRRAAVRATQRAIATRRVDFIDAELLRSEYR